MWATLRWLGEGGIWGGAWKRRGDRQKFLLSFLLLWPMEGIFWDIFPYPSPSIKIKIKTFPPLPLIQVKKKEQNTERPTLCLEITH